MAKSTKNSSASKRSTNLKAINLTNIRRVLKEATFNPKADTPMKAVAEMKEPLYYECRIRELTIQAKKLREEGDRVQYEILMSQVIQLTALAILSS
jgi:hypothetical protein